jgi:hypothetical protein
MRLAAFGLSAVLLLTFASSSSAQSALSVDRALVRFEAAELGGPSHPHFIFQHELAFEARIEALAEVQRGLPAPEYAFEERHLRAALDRHMTEVILASLLHDEDASQADIRRRTISAVVVLEQRVGGRDKLLSAAIAEGMESEDVALLIERQARASLYLDRVVAPMFEPSDAELREVHRTEVTPFRLQRFEDIAIPLRRWYAEERLASALASFFNGARSRILVVWIPKG